MKSRGWWFASVLLGAPLFALLCWAWFCPEELSDGRIDALTPLVAAAVAVTAAYLCFDRFRHAKRARQLSEAITQTTDIPTIVSGMVSGRRVANETNVLVLLIFTGDRALYQKCKDANFLPESSTFYKNFTGWLARVFLIHMLDRKIVIIITVALWIWLFVSTGHALHAISVWGAQPTERWAWIAFILSIGGVLVPVAAWGISEWLFKSLNEQVDEWKAGIAASVQDRAAASLSPPNLGDLTSPTSLVVWPIEPLAPTPQKATRARVRRPPAGRE